MVRLSIVRSLSVPWVVLLVACRGVPAQAQPFSADLVSTSNSATVSVGRIRALNDMVRIETPDFPDGFFLSDGARHLSYFARPNAHVYMDAQQSSWLVGMFVPVDPDDACPRWHDMAVASGAEGHNGQWRCERVGWETLDGRTVVRYRIMSSRNEETFGWIDPDLKFPRKIQRQDGSTAVVENIQQGPQPQQLFEIPAVLQKFDPRQLISRIKQSDVWVEAPAQ